MRILLTGATGFVGRNYLLRCLARGWEVVAPVRDEGKLRQQLAAEGIDATAVYSLPASRPSRWPDLDSIDAAVHSAGALFERDLDSFVSTNVDWTASVLAALPPDCPCVVISSQSAGGPTPAGAPSRDESDPDVPVSFYGESKLRMERLIRRDFEGRPIAILRPPMIIGPRDSATLQLFKMVRSPVRTKPGLKPKTFSFISSDDLMDAIDTALERCRDILNAALYVASRQTFSDLQLIESAAACVNAKGIQVALPTPVVRAVSVLVDAVPSLRAALPSLTSDRAKEILADRWVVNPAAFEVATGWYAKTTLASALQAAADYYRREGRL
ncbi:MAG: NAD(P)-dependent oxidoreductase [Terrimicrobiaceae bacterium]